MNERKRKRKLPGEPQNNMADPWKPTNDEAQVANYLYRKLPATEGRLSGMVVRTFSAVDALDLLMESSWAKVPSLSGEPGGKGGKRTRLFSSLTSVIEFMNQMLTKQMFHRALVVKKSKSSSTKHLEDGKVVKSKKSTDSKHCLPTDLSTSGETNCVTLSGSNSADGEPSAAVDTKIVDANRTSSSSTTSTKASNRPPRLELHPEQIFLATDPESVYVWIYEPPPSLFNWFAGSLLILGIIFCCLFPIWPAPLRLGTYYLTLCASGLFGLLMAVALARVLLYAVCWLVTLGGYSMWLFPNYFADCGFFESFRPVVSLTPIVSGNKKAKTTGSKKSRPKSASANADTSVSSEEVIFKGGDKVSNFVRQRSLDCSKISYLKDIDDNADDGLDEVTTSDAHKLNEEISERVEHWSTDNCEKINAPSSSYPFALQTTS